MLNLCPRAELVHAASAHSDDLVHPETRHDVAPLDDVPPRVCECEPRLVVVAHVVPELPCGPVAKHEHGRLVLVELERGTRA